MSIILQGCLNPLADITVHILKIKIMSRMPFIIKTHIVESAVPKDSQVYDQNQQSKIQVLQAINGYLTINMIIESCKIFWSFWHFEAQCPSFSYLSIGFMSINIIWALCSYFGFRSVRNKNSRHIRIFSYLVVLNLLLRIAMYAICGVVMKGKVPSYANISQQQLHNRICSALYPQTLYIITGIFEALISLLILVLLRGVIEYIQKWQQSETQKLIPMLTMAKETSF